MAETRVEFGRFKVCYPVDITVEEIESFPAEVGIWVTGELIERKNRLAMSILEKLSDDELFCLFDYATEAGDTDFCRVVRWEAYKRGRLERL